MFEKNVSPPHGEIIHPADRRPVPHYEDCAHGEHRTTSQRR